MTGKVCEEMTIRLASDRDQALLAMVIRDAGDAAARHNHYLGRTAVQKIMYFLKASGVEMDYEFDVHHYGPFCSEIMSDMEYLIADGAVEDASKDHPRYSNYRTCLEAEELIGKHSHELGKFADKVAEVARMLAPHDPKELEFYSTLDYVYRWVKATGVPGPFEEPVVQRFLKVKPDVFPEQRIRDEYRAMVELGVFDT